MGGNRKRKEGAAKVASYDREELLAACREGRCRCGTEPAPASEHRPGLLDSDPIDLMDRALDWMEGR